MPRRRGQLAHKKLLLRVCAFGKRSCICAESSSPLQKASISPLFSLLLSLLPSRSCICHLGWALTNRLHLCGCCWLGLRRAGGEGLHSDGVLGTALHQPLILVSLFLFPVFAFFFFFSWGDVCHFNLKKPTTTNQQNSNHDKT